MSASDLTPELVNEALERARLEMEDELAKAGPEAVRTLADVAKNGEKDSDRVSAAKELVAQVRGRAAAQQGEEARAPTFHIVINQLSTGERFEKPIDLPETVMDAVEVSRRLAERADG